MARGVPVQDETREEVLRLARGGMSRNEISRETGVSTAQVSRMCAEAGVSFDRSAIAQATEARSIDLRAMRTLLAEEMSAAGLELLRARHEPYLVYSFGGRDNTYAEHELEKPPVEVIRNAVTTAGIAFDKLTKVLETAQTSTEARSMLVDLADRLGVKPLGAEPDEVAA